MNEHQSWTSLPRIGFDTETTGRDPRQARLVTCSIVYRDAAGKVDKRYWLADPGVEIPPETTAIHGISTEQARTEGRPIEEVLEEIALVLSEHMKRGFPVVAYNAGYDLTLVERELERHGLATLTERLGAPVFPIIDPYYLDRWLDKWRKGKRKLENLVEHYECESTDSFHNAEEDVLATLRVLDAMIVHPKIARGVAEKFPGKGIADLSLEQLQQGAFEAHKDSAMWFNKKDEEAGRPPSNSLEWPIY